MTCPCSQRAPDVALMKVKRLHAIMIMITASSNRLIA
jgi:hypothetical protein